jgi:hypothetical protein
MHPLYSKADAISRDVTGGAIEIHRLKGPELKAVEKILPVHEAQLLSDILLDMPRGLLINFHEMKLIDGVLRLILPGGQRTRFLL